MDIKLHNISSLAAAACWLEIKYCSLFQARLCGNEHVNHH